MAEGNEQAAESDASVRSAVRLGTLVGLPSLILVYGLETWDWGGHESWRWGDEGFFGEDTDLGGADKLGHAYSHYLMTRIALNVFDYTERGGAMKWVYGAAVPTLIGLGIEVGDAFTGRYGFSVQDLTMDLAGVALGLLLEAYPGVDGLVGFSASYWPTQGFREYDDRSILDIEGDTSGWKYTLNLRPAGLEYYGYEMPWYLDYLQLDLGYYTRNYTKYDIADGKTGPQRYWFVGASVNLMQVADDLLVDRSRAGHAVATGVFKYYRVPVAVEAAAALNGSE